MKKWTPKDVVAIIMIAGGVFLLQQGINSWVGGTLVAVACAYFGIDLTPFIKIGRNQGKKKGG